MNLATSGARARIGRWPHEPDIGHLVLADHEMVPDRDDVANWLADARAQGLRTLRTGALFPASTTAFIAAGFVEIDTLVLLQLRLTDRATRRRADRSATLRRATRRLSVTKLADAAVVDGRAFGKRWSNDARSLDEIREATPSGRSRMVVDDGELVGFAMSGRAATRGYIQRLAVDPQHQRSGLGRILVDDALAWMHRHRVDTVLVNTATDNTPALALYESCGFGRSQGELALLERSLET